MRIVALFQLCEPFLTAPSAARTSCNSGSPAPGCGVQLRFIPYTARNLPNNMVFASLLFNSELAASDPRFVSHDLLIPEDHPMALHNYSTHMHMLAYLKSVYPQVPVSLHAGELWPPYGTEEAMGNHIRQALKIGGAKRIGHGASIRYDKEYLRLLGQLRDNSIPVAILLSSNDDVLNVRGANHPFPLYLQHNVPVILATDDPGVSRSNLSNEYYRAVRDYGLSYETVKLLNRNSLQYSYLPGAPLFVATNPPVIAAACQKDNPAAQRLTPECDRFLAASRKAALQWELEKRLKLFERSQGGKLPPDWSLGILPEFQAGSSPERL